jgi:hypothetical protein
MYKYHGTALRLILHIQSVVLFYMCFLPRLIMFVNKKLTIAQPNHSKSDTVSTYTDIKKYLARNKKECYPNFVHSTRAHVRLH